MRVAPQLPMIDPEDEPEAHRRWLEILTVALSNSGITGVSAGDHPVEAIVNQAMAEAFCSNVVANTTATWSEASRMMREPTRRARRQAPHPIRQDLRDIRRTFLQTFEHAMDPWETSTAEEFMDQTKEIHRRMFRHREDYLPGCWKEVPNQGGRTMFAWPENVEPLLRQTFEFGMAVPEGLQRAIIWNFGFINTHPFTNGNGRTGRVIMNNELTRTGQARCVVTHSHKLSIVTRSNAIIERFEDEGLGEAYAECQRQTQQRDWADIDQTMLELWQQGELGQRTVNLQPTASGKPNRKPRKL